MRKRDEYQGGSCIGCGYALRGLSSGRCPECGREFDPNNPATFHQGQPISRLSRLVLRPISVIWVGLALIGMCLTLLATRWPTTWRWPMTDLPLYREMARKPRETFLTQTDWYYTIGIALTAIALIGWLLRVLLQFIIAKRLHITREDRVDQRRRHVLIALAGFATTGMMAFGWPYRIARLWAARLLSGSQGRFNVPSPGTIPLSHELQVVRAAILQLPSAAERIAGLKLLMENHPASAESVIVEAISKERDPAVVIWLIRILGICRNAAMIPTLESFLDHPDEAIRVAAIDAIGITQNPVGLDLGVSQQANSFPAISLSPFMNLNRSLFYTSAMVIDDGIAKARLAPAALRLRLIKLLCGECSPLERQAAARVIANWPAEKYNLRIAEWGVLIASQSGLGFTLAKTILDEIPPFVHQTGNSVSELRDRDPFRRMLVTKPIIHITADQPMAIRLEVDITLGRPWFAFPIPDDLIFNPSTSTAFKPVLEDPTLRRLANPREGYVWIDPAHQLSKDSPRVAYRFGLVWQSLVVMPEHQPWMHEPSVPSDEKYGWWSRLRQVPSSWVWNQDDSERFVYYDGPTAAPNPVRFVRTADELRFVVVDVRTSTDPLEMTMALAGTRESGARWKQREGLFVEVDSNSIHSQVIQVPEADGSAPLAAEQATEEQAANQLLHMLITRGLTKPEAMGLIDAWRPQFFRAIGSRLILIMNSTDYASLCPIRVWPEPTEMVRVGITLTEFGDWKRS